MPKNLVDSTIDRLNNMFMPFQINNSNMFPVGRGSMRGMSRQAILDRLRGQRPMGDRMTVALERLLISTEVDMWETYTMVSELVEVRKA